jgi:hypothetical protein
MNRKIAILGRAFVAVSMAFVCSQASKPTNTTNPLYTQTVVSLPNMTVGSCSGNNTGCIGVTGIDWLSDGRMVLLTTDFEGGGETPTTGRTQSRVTLVSGLLNGGTVATQAISTNFKFPVGVTVVNDRIYVSDKDSFYVVPDNTGANPTTNRQRKFQAPMQTTTGSNPLNFSFSTGATFWHHWIFTPVYYKGKFYANYSGDIQNGGPSDVPPASFFGGSLLAFDTNTSVLDTNINRASGGFRSPNGNNLGLNGEIWSADNQGSQLPMCYLVLVKPFTNQYFGHRQGNGQTPSWGQAWFAAGRLQYDPPVAIMDYAANGWRSLAQPLYMTSGPYAGDVLVGDANSTGIARVAIDSVSDTTGAPKIQCAAMWFSNNTGNDAINRLSLGPDGSIYAGTYRSIGNWPSGTAQNLMYKYTPRTNGSVFEIKKIRSLNDGFELYLSQPVNPGTVTTSNFTVQQKSWVRQVTYGTGASNYTTRNVTAATISNDSLRIHLTVPGIQRINQSRRGDTITHWVTHFLINNLAGANSATNFTNEAWYAQNWISARTWDPVAPTPIAPATQRISMLDNHVWHTAGQGFLRVNVDLAGTYRVTLRDMQGRALARRDGSGAGEMEFAAPGHTQSLYLLEVRSGLDTYTRVVTF